MNDKEKTWFDWYLAQSSKQKTFRRFRDRFLCPCCRLPTLDSRLDFEICTVCWWEDDGQDDDDADIFRGGPNGKYSLTMARHNFKSYGIMYPPNDPHLNDIEPKMEISKRVVSLFKKAAETGTLEDWTKAIEQHKSL